MLPEFVHDKPRTGGRRPGACVLIPALAALLLAACAAAPPPPTRHDFGLPLEKPLAGRALPDLVPGDVAVTAPAWLDSPALLYRLAFADPAQLQSYTRSAWVAPPAALLELRLREAMAARTPAAAADRPLAAGSVRLLVELEEFSQVYDDATSSHAQLQAHVRVFAAPARRGAGTVLAQRSFAIAQPAVTPDAAGGLQALRAAADRFVDQALDWAATLPPATAAAP